MPGRMPDSGPGRLPRSNLALSMPHVPACPGFFAAESRRGYTEREYESESDTGIVNGPHI